MTIKLQANLCIQRIETLAGSERYSNYRVN